MRGGYQTQADVARRVTGFIFLLVGLFLMIALYYVKTRAQTARKTASKLHYTITLEEAAINVLRAEIAHLENPERLQALSETHLGLAPTTTEQMITQSDIAQLFPLKEKPASIEAQAQAQAQAGAQ